jgi:hypothetical protein
VDQRREVGVAAGASRRLHLQAAVQALSAAAGPASINVASARARPHARSIRII